MANSTQAELRTKTRDYMVKIDPNGKIWGDDIIDAYNQRAYFQIQKDGNYEWRFNNTYLQQTAVGGQGEYTLPDDFQSFTLLRYNKQYMNPTDKITLEMQNQTFPSTQIPYQYYIYWSKFGLYPLPSDNGNIELFYNKRFPDLSATQDSELPSDFDFAIVAYGTYIAMISVEKQLKAQMAMTDYMQQMDSLRMAYLYNDVRNTRFTYQKKSFFPRQDVIYFDAR